MVMQTYPLVAKFHSIWEWDLIFLAVLESEYIWQYLQSFCCFWCNNIFFSRTHVKTRVAVSGVITRPSSLLLSSLFTLLTKTNRLHLLDYIRIFHAIPLFESLSLADDFDFLFQRSRWSLPNLKLLLQSQDFSFAYGMP